MENLSYYSKVQIRQWCLKIHIIRLSHILCFQKNISIKGQHTAPSQPHLNTIFCFFPTNHLISPLLNVIRPELGYKHRFLNS